MQFLRFFCAIFTLLALMTGARSAPEAQGEGKRDTTYTLRPNDSIRVSVYGEPELSVPVRILQTGQASFELIGLVEIGGLTVAAAEEKIRGLYAKDFLVDPKLTLAVDEYATEMISVIGAVNTPGPIPIPVSGQLDLASALATAGGLTPTADTGSIQLVRAKGGTSSFSLTAVQSTAARTPLAAGDRIIVNESRFVGKSVKILGQVRAPGSVPFPIDGKLDLVTAIALAGGLTELANPKKVSINRKGTVTVVDFREMTERGNRPFVLQPDDYITVIERVF
jgi:polysaccharide biosynthesis/export protein